MSDYRFDPWDDRTPMVRRLFARRDPSFDAAGLPAYRFDIILRGEGETPFFVD